MHKHIKCDHKLEYCAECDLVACVTCGLEWEKKLPKLVGSNYPTTPVLTNPNPNIALCKTSDGMTYYHDLGIANVYGG